MADLLGEGLASRPGDEQVVRSSTPEVVVFRGDSELTRRLLDRSPVRVGRHPGNDLVLDDRLVSRRHAIIVNEEGQWWLRDLGSRHKFRIDGQRCERHALKDGDRVSIGPFVLLFHRAAEDSAGRSIASAAAHGKVTPWGTLDVRAPAQGGLRITIPGYEIGREIGRGGMGRVYEAIQLSTRRRVALKVMLEGPFSSEKTKRRFEREVRIVAALRHPNIAQIYESGLHEGRYWFAMEYVEGQSLDVAGEPGELSTWDRLSLGAKICEAVGHAHGQMVIHRDLKPSNILISADGEPHVLDFGLAKIEDPDRSHEITLSAPGELMGTPAFMSPEQTERDPRKVDARTDVYSLGIILYRLLTRQFPYDVRGRLDEVIHQIATADPVPPSQYCKAVDDETEAIILRAIAKDPDDRYPSAREMAADLRRRLAGEPVEAKLASRTYLLSKTIARHGKSLLAAVLVVFAIVTSVLMTSAVVKYGNGPPPVEPVVDPTGTPKPSPPEQHPPGPANEPIERPDDVPEPPPTDHPTEQVTGDLDPAPSLPPAVDPREVLARTLIDQLRETMESKDWLTARGRLERLHVEYGQTKVALRHGPELSAWQAQISDEIDAQALLDQVKAAMASQSYDTARSHLERLRTKYDHTQSFKDSEKTIQDYAAQIDEARQRRDAENAELAAQTISLRLEGALEAEDYASALGYLEQLRKDYPETEFVKQNADQIHAWENQVKRGFRDLEKRDNREAGKLIRALEELLDRKDYLRAYLVLQRLEANYSHTTIVKRRARKLERFAAEIELEISKRNLVLRNHYFVDPSPPVTTQWQKALEDARGILERNSGHGQLPALVLFRVLLENEEAEATVSLEGEGVVFWGCCWGASGLRKVASGDIVIAGRGYGPSEGAPQVRIGALYHYSPAIDLEFKDGKVVQLGEIAVRAVPLDQTGTLAVTVKPEAGVSLGGGTVNVGRVGSRHCMTGNQPIGRSGRSVFAELAPGLHFVIAQAKGKFRSAQQSLYVRTGEVTEVELIAYAFRRVTVEWRFRPSRESRGWLRGTVQVLSGGYWQPDDEWDIHHPVLNLSDWDGEKCLVRPSNARMFRVATDGSRRSFTSLTEKDLANATALRSQVPEIGAVYILRDDDDGDGWEAVIRIADFAPVLSGP